MKLNSHDSSLQSSSSKIPIKKEEVKTAVIFSTSKNPFKINKEIETVIQTAGKGLFDNFDEIFYKESLIKIENSYKDLELFVQKLEEIGYNYVENKKSKSKKSNEILEKNKEKLKKNSELIVKLSKETIELRKKCEEKDKLLIELNLNITKLSNYVNEKRARNCQKLDECLTKMIQNDYNFKQVVKFYNFMLNVYKYRIIVAENEKESNVVLKGYFIHPRKSKFLFYPISIAKNNNNMKEIVLSFWETCYNFFKEE